MLWQDDLVFHNTRPEAAVVTLVGVSNGQPPSDEGAFTGVFRGTGPFYVLAGVTNNINLGKDSINRFAMTQPEALP